MIIERICKNLHTCERLVLHFTVRERFLRRDKPRLREGNCELDDRVYSTALSEIPEGFRDTTDLNLENLTREATACIGISSCDPAMTRCSYGATSVL